MHTTPHLSGGHGRAAGQGHKQNRQNENNAPHDVSSQVNAIALLHDCMCSNCGCRRACAGWPASLSKKASRLPFRHSKNVTWHLFDMQLFYCGTVLHELWAAHCKTRPQKAFGDRGSTGPISRAAPAAVAVCDAGASRKVTGASEGRAVAAGARCARGAAWAGMRAVQPCCLLSACSQDGSWLRVDDKTDLQARKKVVERRGALPPCISERESVQGLDRYPARADGDHWRDADTTTACVCKGVLCSHRGRSRPNCPDRTLKYCNCSACDLITTNRHHPAAAAVPPRQTNPSQINGDNRPFHTYLACKKLLLADFHLEEVVLPGARQFIKQRLLVEATAPAADYIRRRWGSGCSGAPRP